MKVGINGLGRIGRAIYRRCLEIEDIEVCVINEANPDVGNIAYTLNYDTIYGPLSHPVIDKGDHLTIEDGGKIAISNVIDCHELIKENLCRRVFVTHAPDANVDFTMVLGCNENLIDIEKHKVIATSICDATAIAPIMELLDKEIGIRAGHVTTLHPWLNYQNLMDGASSSWSVPGEIHHHYALGRSVVGNLIPKPTSAITATVQVLSRIKEESIGSFSYRTPTAIVGSADLTLNLSKDVCLEDINNILNEFKRNQKWAILEIMSDPLVSLDFVNNRHSAVVDSRWTSLIGGNLLKLVLWYDNEAGYSMRVLDQIKYVNSLEKEGA
jgi:glyceraldehyde 3-phosphate dehydrogenase